MPTSTHDRIPLSIQLGCRTGTSNYKSSTDTALGKVFAVMGSQSSEWTEHFKISQHTVSCARQGSTTTQLDCPECGQSVEVTIKRVLIPIFVGYEGITGDVRHKVMSPPKPTSDATKAPPPKLSETIAGVIGLVVIAAGLWFAWGGIRNWYTRSNVRTAATEVVAEISGHKRGSGHQSPALDLQDLHIIFEKLQIDGSSSPDWRELHPNADRSQFELSGTMPTTDGKKIPIAAQVYYRSDRWEVVSISFPEQPPDLLKDHAVNECKRLVERVLTGSVGPDSLRYLVQQPADIEKFMTALQLYSFQTMAWDEAMYNSAEKTCTLRGMIKTHDGRAIPVAIHSGKFGSSWRIQSISSSLGRSEMSKSYGIEQAKGLAEEFLRLIAQQINPSSVGGPSGPGANLPGAGGSAVAGPPGGEPPPGNDPAGTRYVFDFWIGDREERFATGDLIAHWFQDRHLADYQKIAWSEATYEPDTMACVLHGVATLTRNRTVPLTFRIAFVRRNESKSTTESDIQSRKEWHIQTVSSP